MTDLTPEKRAELRAQLEQELDFEDDFVCARCHESYSLADETEPTRFCHGCAHQLAETVVLSLLDALDERGAILSRGIELIEQDEAEIQALRRELAEANAKLEAAKQEASEQREIAEDQNRQREKWEILSVMELDTDTDKFCDEHREEAKAKLLALKAQLAAAQRVVELNAAEREALNASIAAFRAATECVEEEAALYRAKRRDAIRRLLVLRAAAKPSAAEGEG